ncbi:cytidylate kinase-like family protein [Desulfoferrobacter suflitae]|uniref:cytidylate kinase-like family protein n=1 Tax=Desulfoferrobacter suflitae TaxID=2865782 RepID=UPI0021647706|nr:cytidylate kinase-like family protein [Desulfoferrobacter suflitae]MCK8601739.1 cytidylate kinase-like family protein [Desulfoferrobacter suflitae]
MAVITISREFASGGRLFARKLGEQLGYSVLEKELVAQVAEDLNISESEATLFEKNSGSKLLRFLDRYTSHTVKKVVDRTYGRLDDRSYYDVTTKLVLQVAAEGNVIILGWGGQCILEHHPNTLHLRIVKDLPDRIALVRENHPRLDERAAQEYIEREDREKGGYIEHYFDRSVNDPHLYHMTLNLTKVNTAEALKMITEYVSKQMNA